MADLPYQKYQNYSGGRMLKLDYGSGEYDTLGKGSAPEDTSSGKMHDTFPAVGKAQPAYQGSQSSSPSKEGD